MNNLSIPIQIIILVSYGVYLSAAPYTDLTPVLFCMVVIPSAFTLASLIVQRMRINNRRDSIQQTTRLTTEQINDIEADLEERFGTELGSFLAEGAKNNT